MSNQTLISGIIESLKSGYYMEFKFIIASTQKKFQKENSNFQQYEKYVSLFFIR